MGDCEYERHDDPIGTESARNPVPPEVVEALSRPHELRVQHWRSTKDDDRYTLMQLAARREASVIRLIPDGQEVVVVSQERWDIIDRFIRGER